MTNSRKNSYQHCRHLLFAAVVCALGISAAPASAALPKVAVVIGDSFASGQGGRWLGNSHEGFDGGDRADTDEAAYQDASGWHYNRDIPYMHASVSNGCNRSNWAPITYLKTRFPLYLTGFTDVVNLACSGARNKHLWPVASGGSWFNGEAPQVARLGLVADYADIDLIVIGIGGNDMGFADAVAACAEAWGRKHWTTEDDATCVDKIEADILPKLGDTFFNTAKTIQLVRQQMAALNDTNYKIVLTGYPAIIPGFNDWGYDAGDRRVKRCPFNGPDAAYVDEVLMPKLNSTMEAVAHQEGVDFINLQNAFDGHRLCETGAGRRIGAHGDWSSHLNEWVRYVDTTGLDFNVFKAGIALWLGTTNGVGAAYIAGDQGTLSESLHPNKFGQEAIGDCLREYKATAFTTNKAFKCANSGSGYASAMQVALLPTPPLVAATTDAFIPDGTSSLSIAKTLSTTGRPGEMMRTELKISHALKGQLKISVRSPTGRIYLIRDVNPLDGGAFPSVSKNFFYDAPAESGTWTLKIEDKVSGVSGTFLDWKAFYY